MKSEETLNPGERIDDLQRGGCRIIQDGTRFCFGMDAVLLAAFAMEHSACCRQGRSEIRVLDLCAGNGILPILMDARDQTSRRQKTDARDQTSRRQETDTRERTARARGPNGQAVGTMQFTGIEIQPEEADRANRSVRMNGQQERIRFITGDIREADGLIPPASFDIVTANPPYMSAGAGLTGPNKARMIARHEILCTIADVTGAAARALRPGGLLYIVHRPHRLEDITAALRSSGLALRCLRTVHPYADREANLLLIEAVKGGGTNVRVEPPLILYREKGESTEELRRIYSD